MGDYGYFSYPHVGINVPNTCPFFPNIRTDAAGITYIRFNQSYVFDWQTKKEGYKELEVIKISGIDQIFQIPAEETQDTRFFVKITTAESQANVASASIEKKYDDEVKGGSGDFHYSADNPEDGYANKSGEFWIPVCNFNKDGVLIDLFLRENIHWQKINFANLPEEGSAENCFGVLKKWGDTPFNDNPNVTFQNLIQREAEYTETGEHFIKLEQSGGGIVITTQLPALEENQQCLLWRSSDNQWQWIKGIKENAQLLFKNKDGELSFVDTYDGVPYVNNDELQFLRFDEAGSPSPELPSFVAYDGTDLTWVGSEECEETNPDG